ncbi:phenylacetic acid degradation protein [Sulfoacidibacillus ferrooxidans]|uniref:Ring-1,2-phenylacetyl-CoA epoxidase subunit PaaB n=1 Tax=Sulfoacidibacillus ferrooxidans TaxID=2005001 RepID=A0A9X2AFG6_9BACL|nr:hypothetical protein [Sulfoacidibacillus ferrooxidans]
MGKDEEALHYDVFEVFVQKDPLSYHQHVGSVVAPSDSLAVQVARESFLRREKAVNLWVVRQNNIYQSPTDSSFFSNRELGKDYREVAGYADNAHQWKALKQRVMTIDDLVRD